MFFFSTPSDTDSVIFACAFESYDDCLRVNDAKSRGELAALFEELGSGVHQTGLLKDEGCFSLARFRSQKSYLLRGDLQEVRRLRSVTRAVQLKLSDSHFGQDPQTNAPVTRTTVMRPTAGLEVAILQESRRLSHSLNLRMVAVVSLSRAPLL